MNKNLIAFLLLVVLGMNVQAAENNSRNYWGLAYTEMNASAGADVAPTGIMFRLGHRFSYDFGIEFHTGSAQSGADPSIDRINSIFLNWSAPYERFHLYTMIGISRITYNSGGTKAAADSGSYGFGARFDTSGPYTILLEWVGYGTGSDLTANAINLGFTRNF